MIIGFYLWNQFMEYTRDWLAIVWGRGSWLYVPIVKNCRIFHQYWRIEWRFQCSHQWAATASSARSGARSACAYHVIKCATSRKIVPTERMKTKAAVRTPVTFSCSPNDGLLSLFLVFFCRRFFFVFVQTAAGTARDATSNKAGAAGTTRWTTTATGSGTTAARQRRARGPVLTTRSRTVRACTSSSTCRAPKTSATRPFWRVPRSRHRPNTTTTPCRPTSTRVRSVDFN